MIVVVVLFFVEALCGFLIGVLGKFVFVIGSLEVVVLLVFVFVVVFFVVGGVLFFVVVEKVVFVFVVVES